MIGRVPLPIVEGMNIPFALSGCHAESLPDDSPDHLVIQVLREAAGGRCPDCDCPSLSVHSRFRRTPADLPCSTSRTSLRIEVRRFYGPNPSCGRRTFVERWPELIEPRARRTRRLGEVQCDGDPSRASTISSVRRWFAMDRRLLNEARILGQEFFFELFADMQ